MGKDSDRGHWPLVIHVAMAVDDRDLLPLQEYGCGTTAANDQDQLGANST
jgi:hypothetical protein